MYTAPIRVLLIEDDLGDADLITEFLDLIKSTPFQITHHRCLQEVLQPREQDAYDVILLDLSLPDSFGLETVEQVYNQFPTIPIVILSGLEDESLATIAVQKGAQDYLVKGDFDSNLLVRSIRYAIERSKIIQLLNQKEKQLQQANEQLEHRVAERTSELQHANDQLRTLESQLRLALAQEQELSHFKSRIISTVSHEYRTPLTTINSSAEILERYLHKLDEQKQRKHFQRIQISVKHLTALVEDVLFINKAELEKVEFNPELIYLVGFFEEIVEGLQITVDEKHQLIFTHHGSCECANFDPKLLRQMITNLLSNAIKYSPQGGKIMLTLTCKDKQVVFQVQDQGIGIPQADQSKLFESFSRAGNVGTIAGTGLGLSIVKKCVELHQGEITVKSEVGVGTTFTVKLPLIK
ncbi:MAG: ATP-binding protein [Coleofasciculus sp. B1-GNL1-01]|uniref:ATP-binding protein n=1 Tax=Coleofasciculus sp. B1-GNL1-01 TaxID=3068484 RepID=UPI0032F4CCBC